LFPQVPRACALSGPERGDPLVAYLKFAKRLCQRIIVELRVLPRSRQLPDVDYDLDLPDLLPAGYFHVVFTLPREIADVALQNKAAAYGLLFRAASETMTTIAADPRHLGAASASPPCCTRGTRRRRTTRTST
jgi:hypothetical protein